MNGETILREHLLAVHEELHPGANLNPDDVIKWITAILEAIRNCRNSGAALDHIRRGSAIAVMAARNALIREGYRGNALAFARGLVNRGTKLKDFEQAALVSESEDVPAPPPIAGGGWPAWVLVPILCLFGFASSAVAGEFAGGGWVVPETNLAAQEDANYITNGGGWHVSIPSPPIAPPKVVIPETPKPRNAAPKGTASKPDLPWVQPWVFYGDTGPASMRQHLMEPDHMASAMAYLGVRNTADYQQELARLNHSELKQLHSIAHERQEGRRVPAIVKRISYESPQPPKPVPSQTVQAQVLASGGCPGGVCPANARPVRQTAPRGRVRLIGGRR